jgi:hypothetical protein
MQEPVSDNMFPVRVQQPDYWVMISDLMSLIERIRTCMQIASDSQDCEETEDNVVVLNDIAPQDTLRNNALNDCCLQLREALHFMLEARSSSGLQDSRSVVERLTNQAAAAR